MLKVVIIKGIVQMLSGKNLKDLFVSEQRKGEGLLPQLIGKLISATVNIETKIHVPSGDSIWTPGFDVTVSENNYNFKFVPQGNSLWEIGTNKNGMNKIKADYEKRKNNNSSLNIKEYSYIAVSMAIINSTEILSFCETSNKDGCFKNVSVIDANDIAEWLNGHPEIVNWLLTQFNKLGKDSYILSVNDYWRKISERTEPKFSPDLFLSGNELKSQAFIEKLSSLNSEKFFVVSSNQYGRQFPFLFSVASLIKTGNKQLTNHCIIVDNQSELDYVSLNCNGYIILINCYSGININFNPINNAYIFFNFPSTSSTITLNMIDKDKIICDLNNLGFTNHQSFQLATKTNCNPINIYRELCTIPELKVPTWYSSSKRTELIPLMLLEQMDANSIGDIELLKTMIGVEKIDSFYEEMNEWTLKEDSPIIRVDDTYKLYDRKDCFQLIQVDLFSFYFKRFEDKVSSILEETDNKYYSDPSSWVMQNSKYIWNTNTIGNILDGFVLLASKSSKNQYHFDFFVQHVLDSLKLNFELTLTILPFFEKLAELSPSNFLNYLKSSIKNDDVSFKKIITTDNESFLFNPPVNQLLFAIDYLLQNKKTSLDSFKVLLDIYFDVSSRKEIESRVLYYLSPFSTKVGQCSLPIKEKNLFFFAYIDRKDKEKAKELVKNGMDNFYEGIFISDNSTFRDENEKEVNISNEDLLFFNENAQNWLMLQKDSQSSLIVITKVINEIDLLSVQKAIEKINLLTIDLTGTNMDDKSKALACYKIQEELQRINQYKEWEELKPCNLSLKKLLSILEPKDLYERYKLFLINDSFPLPDFSYSDDNNAIESERQARDSKRESIIQELISFYTEKEFFARIVVDCNQYSFDVWPIIYKLTRNIEFNVDLLLKAKNRNGLKYYLSRLPIVDIKLFIKKYSKNPFFISCLPFKEQIFSLIDGLQTESYYWKNNNAFYIKGNISENVFNKFITFSPVALLDKFVNDHCLDFSHGLRIIKAIANQIDDANTKKQLSFNIYEFQKFVSFMDENYYSDELSICEFILLGYLLPRHKGLPLGLQVYFWKHPIELAKLLTNLLSNLNDLDKNSIGFKLLFASMSTMNRICYIPIGYLTQEKEKLLDWVSSVIACAQTEKDSHLLCATVSFTLSFCPKINSNGCWPNKEIADILEKIPTMNSFITERMVSQKFADGYLGLEGFRTIGDGSDRIAKSKEFIHYQENYLNSNPITSDALGMIADQYIAEGEEDSKNSELNN